MVKYIRDTIHGFSERPHYEPAELEATFERLVTGFLKEKYGKVEFPFKTDDITTLIERDVSDLDQYADLARYGDTVEGVTEFKRNGKPKVLISNDVHKYENRLRTTLTHEYGHVILHNYLFGLEQRKLGLEKNQSPNAIYCKRETIVAARKVDWMEWQASYASGVALMPKSYVYAIVEPIRERLKVFGAVEPTSEAGRSMVQALVTTFEVSREAATVRLKVLKLLGSPPATRSLFD